MHIEGSDIPAVMQTCKTLYSVTMTRQFWYHRIDQLCKEHLVSPPEEELEDYTIAELEKWSLRRIRARCNTLPTKVQPRSQGTEPSFIPILLELVPGGRWLLAPHRGLRVCFFDLDSNDLKQHLLFDPGHIEPNLSYFSSLRSNIWIDHKAPRLSFRYAICHLVNGGGDGLESSRVQIYQVNLIGHGADATLVAQIIATFRTPRNSGVSSYTFNDRYFVQGREKGDDETMEVYDYKQALRCLDHPLIEPHTTCPLGDVTMRMQFINEDIFAVRSWDTYRIFNIESPISTIRLHTIDSGYIDQAHSRICWTPEVSLITRIREDQKRDYKVTTIHGIVIPHNSTISPWSIELGKFSQKYGTDLKPGILISMTCNQTNNISRINHEWDFTSQNSDPTHVSISEPCEADKPLGLVTFDEDTGRSIHFSNGKLNVVDIVMAG